MPSVPLSVLPPTDRANAAARRAVEAMLVAFAEAASEHQAFSGLVTVNGAVREALDAGGEVLQSALRLATREAHYALDEAREYVGFRRMFVPEGAAPKSMDEAARQAVLAAERCWRVAQLARSANRVAMYAVWHDEQFADWYARTAEELAASAEAS